MRTDEKQTLHNPKRKNEGSTLVAVYYINNKKIQVDGCWDNQTPEGKYDFYDLFSENGNCLNLGNPIYDEGYGVPTYEDTYEILKDDFLNTKKNRGNA